MKKFMKTRTRLEALKTASYLLDEQCLADPTNAELRQDHFCINTMILELFDVANREDINSCKDHLREVRDTGDLWGSALNEHFDVAEELHRRGSDIPDHWEFSIGNADCDDQEHEFYGEFSDDVLQAFGNILERYIDFLRFKKMDY